MKPNKRKKSKKSDFPNQWKFFKKLKPSKFNRLTYKEVVENLASYWELPPHITLVARAHHLPSGRITEHTFQSVREVRKFMGKISETGEPYHIHCFDDTQTFTAVFNDD